MKISRGDIREDGMYYDGSQWRRKGVEHHMTDDGLVYCQGKFRTLESYLQRGGKPEKIKHYSSKVSVINTVVTNLYNKPKEGDVYIIANKAWNGWVKIGMALDAEDRLNSYQTSSPYRDYVLIHKEYFKDRRRAEAQAHKEAGKIAEEQNSEWFKLDNSTAILILKGLDKGVPDKVKQLTGAFKAKK